MRDQAPFARSDKGLARRRLDSPQPPAPLRPLLLARAGQRRHRSGRRSVGARVRAALARARRGRGQSGLGDVRGDVRTAAVETRCVGAARETVGAAALRRGEKNEACNHGHGSTGSLSRPKQIQCLLHAPKCQHQTQDGRKWRAVARETGTEDTWLWCVRQNKGRENTPLVGPPSGGVGTRSEETSSGTATIDNLNKCEIQMLTCTILTMTPKHPFPSLQSILNSISRDFVGWSLRRLEIG